MRDDDQDYAKHTITLETVNHGTVVGRPNEFLHQVVTARYGPQYGYLPWNMDGFEGLIVEPTQRHIWRGDLDHRERPTMIQTEQRVIDWVVSMKTERVS